MRVDVESLLVSYLKGKGYTVTQDVGFAYSRQSPDRFLTVERTGGSMDEDGITDNAAVVIQAWAPTRSAAMHLAVAVDSQMFGFEATPYIYRVQPQEMVNFPPLDGTKRGRYQLSYTITTYNG